MSMPSPRLLTARKVLVLAAALLITAGWLLNTPHGFFGKLDAIGYAVCHQIPERSFHVGAFVLPLCTRCSGMYLGAITGLVFQSLTGWKRARLPHWSILAFLGLFVAAFGIDGSNSYLTLLKQVNPGILPGIAPLYAPNNTLRLLTGSGMGIGIASLIFPAFNQTIWADGDDKRRALDWKRFGLLLLIQIVLNLLVLTESPFVLYPLAVISGLGVWLLLTMVYTIVWVMLMGEDNRFTRLPQLWLAIMAGFTLAMIQTAAIDLVRLWLTGTWGSFPLAG
jgi:uncharacterized membrane protein